MKYATGPIRRSKVAGTVLAVVIVFNLPIFAPATEATPYFGRRVSPLHSDWYAVISGASGETGKQPIFGPVVIRVVKRRLDAPHAQPGIAFREGFRYAYNRDSGLRTGDVVMGQFKLDAPPARLLVSTTGHGVMAFGVRPPDPRRAPLAYFENHFLVVSSADASILYHKPAEWVLGRARETKDRIGGAIGKSAAWIDESNARVLFVCEVKKEGRDAAEWVVEDISLKDATVTAATSADVVASISKANACSLPTIVETAIAMNVVLVTGRDTIQSLLSEDGLSTSERVAVAAFLAHCGAKMGTDVVLAEAKSAAEQLRADPTFGARVGEAIALGNDIGFDDRTEALLASKLAIEFLGGCLGADALPLLRDIVSHSAEGGVMNEAAAKSIKRIELKQKE